MTFFIFDKNNALKSSALKIIKVSVEQHVKTDTKRATSFAKESNIIRHGVVYRIQKEKYALNSVAIC